jgi:hypothetical protein
MHIHYILNYQYRFELLVGLIGNLKLNLINREVELIFIFNIADIAINTIPRFNRI